MEYIQNSNREIKLLSRYASMARARTISRINSELCIATLISFTIGALDDVIDIMD